MNSEKNLLQSKKAELIREEIEQSVTENFELTEDSVSSKSAIEATPYDNPGDATTATKIPFGTFTS